MTGGPAPGTVRQWPIDTEMWLVRPSSESRAQKQLIQQLRAEAHASALTLEEVRCAAERGRQGRTLQVLSPADVRKLYVRSHKAHVFVASITAAKIRVDPSQHADRNNILDLAAFLRYKAHHLLVTRPNEVVPFVQAAASAPATGCDGLDDPRCLPLHVFSPQCALDLSDHMARQQFMSQYSSRTGTRQKCWKDESERTWIVDKAMHGRDELHVVGLRLPVGFHWDVQTPRRRTVLVNGWQRWEASNSAYLNVHPDAHVRSTRATLVWTWDKPKPMRGTPRQK